MYYVLCITMRFCTSFFSVSTLALALALSPGSNKKPVGGGNRGGRGMMDK